jgi:hypothetical protein
VCILLPAKTNRIIAVTNLQMTMLGPRLPRLERAARYRDLNLSVDVREPSRCSSSETVEFLGAAFSGESPCLTKRA